MMLPAIFILSVDGAGVQAAESLLREQSEQKDLHAASVTRGKCAPHAEAMQ